MKNLKIIFNKQIWFKSEQFFLDDVWLSLPIPKNGKSDSLGLIKYDPNSNELAWEYGAKEKKPLLFHFFFLANKLKELVSNNKAIKKVGYQHNQIAHYVHYKEICALVQSWYKTFGPLGLFFLNTKKVVFPKNNIPFEPSQNTKYIKYDLLNEYMATDSQMSYESVIFGWQKYFSSNSEPVGWYKINFEKIIEIKDIKEMNNQFFPKITDYGVIHCPLSNDFWGNYAELQGVFVKNILALDKYFTIFKDNDRSNIDLYHLAFSKLNFYLSFLQSRVFPENFLIKNEKMVYSREYICHNILSILCHQFYEFYFQDKIGSCDHCDLRFFKTRKDRVYCSEICQMNHKSKRQYEKKKISNKEKLFE